MRDAPILALHGFTGRGGDWEGVADATPGRVWITPDLPGHGPTPHLPADLRAHLALIFEAAGTSRPALLGYSLGGRVALHAALARPEKFSSLTLLGASPGIDDEEEREARLRADSALAERILKMGAHAFLAEWDATPLLAGRASGPEPWRTRSLLARRENTPAGLAASLAGAGVAALPPLRAKLASLQLPTHFIAGENDTKFSALADEMQKLLPGSRVTQIPDAGHAAHLENPTGVARAITA